MTTLMTFLIPLRSAPEQGLAQSVRTILKPTGTLQDIIENEACWTAEDLCRLRLIR